MTTATAPTDAPVAAAGPISIPRGALYPGKLVGTVTLLTVGGSLVLSALRPKQVPPPLQRAADGMTAVVVAFHPLEAATTRRYARKRGADRTSARRAATSSLVFGVMGTVKARRNIKRATR